MSSTISARQRANSITARTEVARRRADLQRRGVKVEIMQQEAIAERPVGWSCVIRGEGVAPAVLRAAFERDEPAIVAGLDPDQTLQVNVQAMPALQLVVQALSMSLACNTATGTLCNTCSAAVHSALQLAKLAGVKPMQPVVLKVKPEPKNALETILQRPDCTPAAPAPVSGRPGKVFRRKGGQS